MKFFLFLIFLTVFLSERSVTAEPCTGAFLHKDGGILTVSPFDLGDGQQHFVFVDFRTGYIRLLKQESNEFTAGPALLSDSLIELHLQCIGENLRLQKSDGSTDHATKLHMKEEGVQFASREINLSGSLFIPEKMAPLGTILMLHGSGPLNRYSFGPIPYFFAASGFVVLVYDKRGTGQSAGNFDTATLEQLSDDGAAALAYLKSRKDIDPNRIGVWGSSQGGFLAAAVVAKSKKVNFLIDQSGMYVPVWQQEIYRTRSEMQAQGYSPVEISNAQTYLDHFFTVASTGKNWEKLQQEMIALKTRPWFDLVPKADDLKTLRWYWQTLYSYDPQRYLEKVNCPVLGVFGALDRSTPVTETIERMKKALQKARNTKFEYRIFASANHGLLEAKTGSEREIPELRKLVPEAFAYQRTWLTTLMAR
jgi:uncharacterized protein